MSSPALPVSQDDLLAFHATHLSSEAVDNFASSFTPHHIPTTTFQHAHVPVAPAEDDYYIDAAEEEEEDDDGLGYYPDGTKRTLTDAHIAIFRHSEIQALIRERRHAGDGRTDAGKSPMGQQAEEEDGGGGGGVEQGEVEIEIEEKSRTKAVPSNDTRATAKARRKSKIANRSTRQQKGGFGQNTRPDLRKRTWDKVEPGLSGLDYDDADAKTEGTIPESEGRRRKVRYEDD